jgi:nucleotide-binding universal stress UspA family protein
MTYKSILVQAEPGQRADARVKCAANLADRFKALLLGVGAACMPMAGFAQPYNAFAAEWAGGLRDQLESDLRSAEESFRRGCGSRASTWLVRHVEPATALVDAARTADLIVLGGASLPGPGVHNSADVTRVLLTSGRPVLLAPPDGDYCSARQIVVAWKDTPETRRAVADAMPLLERADDVVILQLCDPSELATAELHTAEVALALARHGVRSRGEAEVCEAGLISSTLLDFARRQGADLMVAGAYGHSRLGEWVFGGVTRDLLHQSQLFVLFSR